MTENEFNLTRHAKGKTFGNIDFYPNNLLSPAGENLNGQELSGNSITDFERPTASEFPEYPARVSEGLQDGNATEISENDNTVDEMGEL